MDEKEWPPDVVAAAEAESARWSSIALVARISPAAGAQLQTCGLDAAHAALPSSELLPLLREMVYARSVSQSEPAQLRRPAELQNLNMLLAPPEGECSTAVPIASDDNEAIALLIVARHCEDVDWLQRLPPRVDYHIMQKHALQPELPTHRQTLLPNVGRESHSYLSFFASCCSAEGESAKKVLPPLLVCAQADPFDHNPHFLSDVASLIARADAAAARGGSGATSAPLTPPFMPLGVWSGGERFISCDATGAPHQPKLLPIRRTWLQLFGGTRALPLWLSFTPGACFAVASSLVLSHPLSYYQSALACGLSESVDPIEGHVFERLWLYLLFEDDVQVQQLLDTWASEARGWFGQGGTCSQSVR